MLFRFKAHHRWMNRAIWMAFSLYCVDVECMVDCFSSMSRPSKRKKAINFLFSVCGFCFTVLLCAARVYLKMKTATRYIFKTT